ncbi:MAG: hypothetical protein IJB70_04830 [Clostridia bacterium]|nr:hypothetical protein [Clostridia bacterium]
MSNSVKNIALVILLIFCTVFGYKLYFREEEPKLPDLKNNTILKTELSPDGNHVAVIFRRSKGGATTWFSYHLSIIETGQRIGDDDGNVYSGKERFDFSWNKDGDVLTIKYREGSRIYKQIKTFKDINITYEYLSTDELRDRPFI